MSKRKSKAKAAKDLKQTSKAARKAGLTPGQIAGIVGGSVAVAGLGTTAAVLAAKDKEIYYNYIQRARGRQESALGGLDSTKGLYELDDNFYDKIRGFRGRYYDQLEEERRAKIEEDDKYYWYKIRVRNSGGLGKHKDTNPDKDNKRRERLEEELKNQWNRGGINTLNLKDHYMEDIDKRQEAYFGKKKRRKVSKKPSAALRRMCKRLKVRLTVKRGKKRVYKSEKVLKKQCKKAKRRKK